MSEAEKLKTAEAKLKQLASRLNRGWDALHPVKAKQLEKVNAAIAAKWAKAENKFSKQSAVAKTEKPKRANNKSGQSARKKKSNSKSKGHGQSH